MEHTTKAKRQDIKDRGRKRLATEAGRGLKQTQASKPCTSHGDDRCPVCTGAGLLDLTSSKLPTFDERFVGGVFDGFGVVSDADPCL